MMLLPFEWFTASVELEWWAAQCRCLYFAISFSSTSTPNNDVNRTPFKVKAYGLKHPLAKGYNKSIETD